MSAFYEPCASCAAWVPSDQLARDGSCLACQGDGCVRCHASDAEPGSNLCLECVEWFEVAPLLDLVWQGVSVQLRDERLWGLACGLGLIGGEVMLVLDVHDGTGSPPRKLPLHQIALIELCVRDAISDDGRATDEFLAWEQREREAEGIFSHAREATEMTFTDDVGAGVSSEGDEEPYEDDDDDDDWDWNATVAAVRAASERSAEERSQMMETLLATLDALEVQPWPGEGEARGERVPMGVVAGTRGKEQAASPRRAGAHGRLRRLRLRPLLRRLLREAEATNGGKQA